MAHEHGPNFVEKPNTVNNYGRVWGGQKFVFPMTEASQKRVSEGRRPAQISHTEEIEKSDKDPNFYRRSSLQKFHAENFRWETNGLRSYEFSHSVNCSNESETELKTTERGKIMRQDEDLKTPIDSA